MIKIVDTMKHDVVERVLFWEDIERGETFIFVAPKMNDYDADDNPKIG